MSKTTTQQGAVEMTVPKLAQQVADNYRIAWGYTFRAHGETLRLNTPAFADAIAVFVLGDGEDAHSATLMLQAMLERDRDGLSAFGQRFMEALLLWLAQQVYQAKDEANNPPRPSAQLLRLEDYRP
ncbi:hypothetical protein GL272_12595 [Aeromonas veronii]|uniref:hypothetical protein n=1 Tax=Aeromonas veronii TaxID=654 RepID=UPI001C5A6B93|nr:hypothetical protein [Aeromonas veronii]MBW3777752.1 hypothetical protein [Aeromonas veronii]